MAITGQLVSFLKYFEYPGFNVGFRLLEEGSGGHNIADGFKKRAIISTEAKVKFVRAKTYVRAKLSLRRLDLGF